MPLPDYSEKDERAPLPFCEDVEAANAKKATAASAAHSKRRKQQEQRLASPEDDALGLEPLAATPQPQAAPPRVAAWQPPAPAEDDWGTWTTVSAPPPWPLRPPSLPPQQAGQERQESDDDGMTDFERSLLQHQQAKIAADALRKVLPAESDADASPIRLHESVHESST